MSATKDRGITYQIPLADIQSITVDNKTGSLNVHTQPSESTRDTLGRSKIDRWWNANLMMAFAIKAEVWLKDEGSKTDLEAGGTNENFSHFMAESHAEDILVSNLRTTKGHYRGEFIVDRALKDAHSIEIQKGKLTGTLTPFVLHFADILGQARDYSPTRIEALKARIVEKAAA